MKATEEAIITSGPLFRHGHHLRVSAEAVAVDLRPADFGPGTYADPAVLESWRRQAWRFCTPRVSIVWHRVVIGTAVGAAQPHGHVAGEYVDALSKQRREHGAAPILSVVQDALGDARVWAATLDNPPRLREALAAIAGECVEFAGAVPDAAD